MKWPLTWTIPTLSAVISVGSIFGLDAPSWADSPPVTASPTSPTTRSSVYIERIEGQLDETDRTADGGTFVDAYSLSLEAGESVGITLESLVFDVYLQLVDGVGQVVAEVDDISEIDVNAFLVFTAAQADNYEIRATSYAPSVGEYGLTIERGVVPEAAVPQLSDAALMQTEARRLRAQGIAAFDQGNMAQALADLQAAQVNYAAVGDRAGEASAWYNQGRVYAQIGNMDGAIAAYDQSAALHRENGDQRGESVALNSLGLIYARTGRYTEAQTTYDQALTLVRAIGEQDGEATILGHLGTVFKAMGNYPQALEIYNQSLALAKTLQDPHSEGITLNNIGTLYYLVGRYDAALGHYETALDLVRAAGDRVNEINILSNIGVIDREEGRYDAALDIYQQALDLAIALQSVRSQGVLYNNIGVVNYELGQYDAALAVYEQALAIAQQTQDTQRQAIILSNMGVILEQQSKLDQALARHQAALDIAPQSDLQGFILNNLGNVLLTQGDLDGAIAHFFDSIAALEALRADLDDTERIALIDTQRSPYLSLQQALIQQNRVETALEVAERNRAQAFVELLAQRSQAQTQVTVEPPTLATIQQIAREQNATFVEYSLMDDDRLFIWVIQPDGRVTFRQSDVAPLRSPRSSPSTRRETSLNVRLERNPSRQRLQLRQLYNQLIAPIADLLPTDPEERVTFIPESELLLVPFPALLNEAGDYLIQQHTILTAPSIQALGYAQGDGAGEGGGAERGSDRPSSSLIKASRDLAEGDAGYLVVGNPVMPTLPSLPGELPVTLAPLPASEQEALTIGKLLNSPVLTGNIATESTVKGEMPRARLIHLATHGLLNYGIPDQSNVQDMPGAIALSPSRRDQASEPPSPTASDGLLSSQEILDLDLQADLVVLSACDSGLGRITGDGVIGLSRSFLAAGAASVVVSLWSVPDSATAELMVVFYENMLQGRDKGRSLRYAMLETLEQYPNPLDWAAFTLIGNANTPLFAPLPRVIPDFRYSST